MARMINMGLGSWLFISAYLWPHSDISKTNTWITGLLCVVFAAVAIKIDWFRWLNTVLACWLVISTLGVVHESGATPWNNSLVAVAIFVVSLLPSRYREDGPT
jgi:hypothetical protein